MRAGHLNCRGAFGLLGVNGLMFGWTRLRMSWRMSTVLDTRIPTLTKHSFTSLTLTTTCRGCELVSVRRSESSTPSGQLGGPRHYISLPRRRCRGGPAVDECPNETLRPTPPVMGLFDPPPGLIPAADLPNYSGYSSNPYLSYRPVFARSLPIQILIGGITLTLVSILLVQLSFTAPYHFRLARVNFFLQVSAAVILLASQIATLTLLLNDTMRQSQNWPFMLEYVAVDLPPLNFPRSTEGWSLAGLIAWLFMNALVSALTQVRCAPCDGTSQFIFTFYRSRTSNFFPSCIPPASRHSS